jgi:carbon-monoxide dehydrogenase small subunit
MSANIDIEFRLNGQLRRCAVPPTLSTLDMLREVIGLTGTKYGCGEGECGACTINVDGRTLNSCLMFAVDCDGRELRTIEGIAATPAGERLVKSLTEHGAVQCGFCTPGMVVQAEQILAQDPKADEQAIGRGLEGNLCRCTGYRKIIDAVEALAAPAGASR